jgi:calcium-dependent protein kinase
MGCSISSTMRKVSLADTGNRISSMKEIVVQPSLFIVKNPNKLPETYKIGQLLGTGRNSEVRLCTHRDTNEKRAVKIFRKYDGEIDASNDFLREINILKCLDHPNIVRIYEYFEDSRRMSAILEYCSGGELFTEILKTTTPLHEITIAKIMQQLFSALCCIHEQNVIHRDIKPENILLEEKENMLNIKIIDFGSAVKCQNGQTKGFAGSYDFCAPEVLNESYGCKADVWSAGVLLCILLSGSAPYESIGPGKLRYFTAEERFGFPEEIWLKTSAGAKDLLSKMLCFEASRLSALECLNHSWVLERSYKPICNENILNSVLSRMRTFHSYHKLREAVYTFIITQFISLKETRVLREVFRAIDRNGDGKVSVEELAEQYELTMGSEDAVAEAKRIMKEVDTDNNGFIDYTEFLKVNLDTQRVLSGENLKHAFRMFDKDGSGAISATELKTVLQGDMESEDSVWQEIVAKVDQNRDGEIDLQEFQDMILSNWSLN